VEAKEGFAINTAEMISSTCRNLDDEGNDDDDDDMSKFT